MHVIALMVEISRAFGRTLSIGAATYMRENHAGRLILVRPSDPDFRRRLSACDGVIARVADDHTARQLASLGKPVIDAFCQKPRPGFFQVSCDHAGIGIRAAEFLLAHRFADYAYCGTSGIGFSDDRERAFTSRLRLEGRRCHIYRPPTKFSADPNALFWNESSAQIPDRNYLAEWIQRLPKPVSVFCCNDVRAYHVLTVCNELGISIPSDVALLGVDNDELHCAFADPPLSSIDPNAFRLGYVAARMLVAAIKQPPRSKHHRPWIVPPGPLIERQSTEFYALTPSWLSDALVFIDANINRAFSMADIFRAVRRSHTSVERAFRDVLGISVIDYVTNRRLNTADSLINDGVLTLKEIADRSGFTSAQYFCRVYKLRRGHTPRTKGVSLDFN